MADLKMSDIKAMQDELQALHAGEWEEICPENARNKLLWMIEEIGEVAAIIKKRGDRAIMKEEAVRGAFIEEMADVMMYFQDILECYGISPDEFSRSMIEKHEYNMRRDYSRDSRNFLPGQKSEIERKRKE